MNTFSHHKSIRTRWLTGLSIAILFIILAAGLRPKDFNFINHVDWIADQPGIRFGRYGLAYTHLFNDFIKKNNADADTFSIEMAFKPASFGGSEFKFIMTLHNGNDSDQLVIGQWRSWLIFMNGNDYANRKITHWGALDIASHSSKVKFITLTTGKAGTGLYLDGKPVLSRKKLMLKIPGKGKTRLLLGNSVYGRSSWQGDILGFALYRQTLTRQKAALHFKRWSEDRNFSFAGDDTPFLFYPFDEKGGTIALDRSGGGHHLEIPVRMPIFRTQILAFSWRDFTLKRSFIFDIFVNLFGFIPFGFVLSATTVKAGGTFEKHSVFIPVALCFAASMFIEILQGWIPSRNSQISDLALNTLGAWIGALTYRWVSRQGQRFARRS